MLNSWPLAKDLQVLVEIVHSGSFSAAAATLGQTPAFVTKRIQILENTLATTLLNRSARGVALTESGQRCYEHALEILTQYQRLVDEAAHEKRESVSNKIRKLKTFALQLRQLFYVCQFRLHLYVLKIFTSSRI